MADGPRGRTRSRKPGFCDRAGAGSSITPFGQPYVIVARKIKDGDPATAVITESGSALPEKLPGIGVENEANAVTGLKRDIAAQTNQNHQTITGLIPAGTRTAQGTGGAFTKDLTAYFTGAFTQAAPVAFVNFKDLDPDGNIGTDPTPDTPGEKVYEGCTIYTKAMGTAYQAPIWRVYAGNANMGSPTGECGSISEYNGVDLNDTCPLGPGRHFEGTAIVSNCSPGAITPVGAMGAFTNNMAQEPRQAAPGRCPDSTIPCFDTYYTGTITMNQVTIVNDFCYSDVWVNHVLTRTPTGGTGMNQSYAGACCAYRWSKPKTTCP